MARNLDHLNRQTPACFDSAAQWESWRKATIYLVSVMRTKETHICNDCTLKFQTKMIAEGRCERPDVAFVDGHAQIEEATAKYKGRPCKRCGNEVRYSSGHCVECEKIKALRRGAAKRAAKFAKIPKFAALSV